MLDENLPTFYVKGSREQRLQRTVYLRQRGDEPAPAYALRHLDPAAPTSRNRYAAALYDPYVPEVVFAEVLVIPEWTQPTLAAEAIRLNGGVPPPPEPILPSQFTIQLYNPDQQVVVHYKPKTWSSNPSWEFEMPQRTFRQPSISTLDRTQSDPAATDVTPKLRFSWRKDSKLSRDLACLLSGKTSIVPESKTKSKEPDITISIFKGLKELTLYEPNLYRVEMEDFKGLEVVLLLGAMVIRDIYFTPMKEAFNLSNPPSPVGQTPVGKQPTPPPTRPSPLAGPKTTANGAINGAASKPQGRPPNGTAASRPPGAPQQRPQVTIPQTRPANPQPPPLDPRSQWEIDAEQTRLRKQQELEQLKAQERAREEERRTKKLLETEEKARRKQQAEIEKETKRLQKLFGKEEEKARAQVQQVQQQRPPPQPPRPRLNYPNHAAATAAPPPSRPNLGPGTAAGGPYLQVPGAAGHARTQSALHISPQQQPPPRPQSVASYSQHHLRPGQSPQPQPPQLQQKKSSFFGLRKTSGEEKNKLTKKRSSMF